MFTNIWNSTGRLSKMATASDISGLRMTMGVMEGGGVWGGGGGD